MKITPRERQVLSLVAEGRTNTEISELLGIKLNTTKNHLFHILNRLGASNRTHAVVIALNNDLIDRPQTDI